MNLISRRLVFAILPGLLALASGSFAVARDSVLREWKTTGELPAVEATQAAAADWDHYYAVANAKVGKYDRATGKRVALSDGEPCKHLNSAILHGGVFYLAHSNYPVTPENSRIMALDPQAMRLSTFHDFGASEGSLTWCLPRGGAWYCFFAYYGAKNGDGYLARFDADWKETARWGLPATLVPKLGQASLSCGVFDGDELLCTGHDDPVLFRLRMPRAGKTLDYVGDEPVAFTGQGFARDPRTGGLIGIDRPQGKLLFAATEPPKTVRLRVLSYNIHHGEGTDGKLDLPRIARIIRDAEPDVVALQEVDRRVMRSKTIDQPAELARLTDLRSTFGANIELQGGEYGNAVLSRYPIARSENRTLPNHDHGEQRGVLEVELTVPGLRDPLFVMATHFDHRRDDAERRASAAAIRGFVGKRFQVPQLLLGDLNDVRTSPTLERLGELWTIAGDERPTIPAEKPTKQIDFILYRPSDRWRVVETRVPDEPTASDHRPILSVLEFVPATKPE
ncbi:MAG: endonuclease/exonuclease/phosphatase family protein [Pirellulales bacterium]